MIIKDSLINHPARADKPLMCVSIRNFPVSNPSSRADRRGRRYPARAIRQRIMRQRVGSLWPLLSCNQIKCIWSFSINIVH